MDFSKFQLFVSLSTLAFSSCGDNSNSELEFNAQTDDSLTSTEVDSSDFYEFFEKTDSDLRDLELIGSVRSVVHYTNHDNQITYFFDTLGFITEKRSNDDHKDYWRPADSLEINHNAYGLPIFQESYYSTIGDYKDGEKCCHQEHFYRCSDSTETIKYYGEYGALLETETKKYGRSKQVLWSEIVGMNRDVFRHYHSYNPEGFLISTINIDGNFGDTTSIIHYKYEFDTKGNWIKKIIESPNDISTLTRSIEYF